VALGEVRRHRGKDITPMEDIADLREPHFRPVQMDEGRRLTQALCVFQQPRRQAVVGPNEQVRPQTRRHRPALGADTGIDDGQMDGPLREIGGGTTEDPGPRSHVLRSDQMAQVHQARLRGDPQDHALHHPDVAVLQAEVREQRDDRVDVLHFRQLPPT
jgi:hypothetical protein